MACHQTILVRAWAGDADVTAAITAANCKNFKADFTIEPIYQPRPEIIRYGPRPHKTPDPPFQSAKRSPCDAPLPSSGDPAQNSHILPASAKWIEPFLKTIDFLIGGL
jgi:hypothetical protein